MERKPTAFLIDDDVDDQEIFSYAMRKADDSVNCVFAEDGMDALQKIKASQDFIPDFIFIDMNMPRMNGQQCLQEIKKIARLKNIPVFMYSTSAEPAVMEENIKLGALEFIIKPPNINDLVKILTRIVKKQVMPLLLLLFCLNLISEKSLGQTDTLAPVKQLKKLSVEELMNIVVTSVSKSPEKLSEVASAIQVVTGEEIKRSGTLRLPGALRLATNMQVYSAGAHDTRIASRGFNGYPIANTSLGDKLLVLIDGRTVYTPLLGGVYWDVQNVLLEDVKQVEVISGPGGSLWGANAVNGIVNIISKSAKETQGIYASGAAGGSVKDFGAIRYGSHIDTTIYYRVYAQRYDINSSTLANGLDAKDGWGIGQGGFRMDYIPSSKSAFTLQGDLYDGKEDDSSSTLVNGQNIIGRWTYRCSDKSGITVQTYFDRTYRNVPNSFIDEFNTFDIDMQHNFSVGNRNKIVWGIGYRAADDNFNSVANSIQPDHKTLQLYSGFVQDQIGLIPDRIDLTIGTKVLHNEYTGLEFQPSVRLAYFVNDKNTLWTSVSRAVRTPSRLDADIASPVKFNSENVIAYELGYRVQPINNVSFSFATYYNKYTHLRSLDTNQTPPPQLYFGNNLKANTSGIEVSANVIVTNWWKVRGGYTWLHEEFATTSTLTYPQSYLLEAIDPQNQFLIQSMMDVAQHFQIDGIVRYVDVVPAAFTLPSVPSYITFDLRIAYNYKWLTISAVGSNLAEKFHGSSGSIKISRSVYGRLTLRF